MYANFFAHALCGRECCLLSLRSLVFMHNSNFRHRHFNTLAWFECIHWQWAPVARKSFTNITSELLSDCSSQSALSTVVAKCYECMDTVPFEVRQIFLTRLTFVRLDGDSIPATPRTQYHWKFVMENSFCVHQKISISYRINVWIWWRNERQKKIRSANCSTEHPTDTHSQTLVQALFVLPLAYDTDNRYNFSSFSNGAQKGNGGNSGGDSGSGSGREEASRKHHTNFGRNSKEEHSTQHTK